MIQLQEQEERIASLASAVEEGNSRLTEFTATINSLLTEKVRQLPLYRRALSESWVNHNVCITVTYCGGKLIWDKCKENGLRKTCDE